jgi:hypothetical protein
MPQARLTKGLIVSPLAALCVMLSVSNSTAVTPEPRESKTSGGLTVYLGVVPAEIVKGPSLHSAEQPMHGRIPHGAHEYHIVAAVFEAATGVRVSDASVTAQVSGLGLSAFKTKLEAMEIAGTTSYGAFFNLPGRDFYSIRLAIERPGIARATVIDFMYDHRR